MKRSTPKLAVAAVVGVALGLAAGTAAAQQRGGILRFVVPA